VNLFRKHLVCGFFFVLSGLIGCSGHLERKTAFEPYDKPGEAQGFFLLQRMPQGEKEFPVEKVLAAQEQAKKMPIHVASTGKMYGVEEKNNLGKSITTWTALGPQNIAGRARVLMFHPTNANIMYAAGAAGGVWVSFSSGNSWFPLGDELANMAVNSLAIDRTTPTTMYAGTGEGASFFSATRGAGIFKSDNGGLSWSQLVSTASTPNFYYVNDLAISPNDNRVIYAATNTGLWVSDDAGLSWVQKIEAGNSGGCTRIQLRTDLNPDFAIVACGRGSPTAAATGIWISDAGNLLTGSWFHAVGAPGSGAFNTIARMGRTELAIALSDQNIVYAVTGCVKAGSLECGANNEFEQGLLHVLRSTDGGITWSTQRVNDFNPANNNNLLLTNTRTEFFNGMCFSSPSPRLLFNQAWYNLAIAVDPRDATKVWVGGTDLWRSDDSGVNWGIASYWWNPPSSSNYIHADVHKVVFHPQYDGITNAQMLVANDGGVFRTQNARAATGTNNTVREFNSICGLYNLPSIAWEALNSRLAITQFYHGSVYEGGTAYFAGTQDNGTLFGTDALGASGWRELYGGDGGFTAVNPSASGTGSVLYGETTEISIKKSSNNGVSFSCATNGIVGCTTPFTANDCGLFINPFVMDPSNANRLYTSGTRLWRTDNAAALWQPASAPIVGAACSGTDSTERFSAYAVASTQPNLLVAGTTFGQICRITNATSSDGSTSLQNCTRPAGTTYVSSIAFDPRSENIVYATISTFGARHVWRSTNAGQDWSPIDGQGGLNLLPDVPAHTVVVSPLETQTLFVGTDIGVFVSLDGGLNWARENTGFANVVTRHLALYAPSLTGPVQLFAFTHGRGVFKTQVVRNDLFSNGFE
jgi:hypothetical protein